MKQPIYLDNHATTPVDPLVREAMLPWLGPSFGNAGSRTHAFGWAAEEAVAHAREQVAGLLGASPDEIVFTAGATEGCNLAIQGLAGAPGDRVVTTAIEHHAVLDTCSALEARGVETEVLPVDDAGRVDPGDVERALDGGAVLVAVMAANNEIGTIQPIAEIGRLARERGIPFLCDAAQAIGRIPVDVEEWGVSLLTLSAHKFYGPQGIGALYVRGHDPRIRLAPLLHGGGQERGRRPGTLNVPGIVGLGAAAAACRSDLATEAARIAGLRDRLEARLLREIPGMRVNGHPVHRLCGNLSVRFPGIEAEALMLALPRLALSAGSACASGVTSDSHVLRAMGLTGAEARQTLRFGLGRFTTEAEIDEACALVAAAVPR